MNAEEAEKVLRSKPDENLEAEASVDTKNYRVLLLMKLLRYYQGKYIKIPNRLTVYIHVKDKQTGKWTDENLVFNNATQVTNYVREKYGIYRTLMDFDVG